MALRGLGEERRGRCLPGGHFRVSRWGQRPTGKFPTSAVCRPQAPRCLLLKDLGRSQQTDPFFSILSGRVLRWQEHEHCPGQGPGFGLRGEALEGSESVRERSKASKTVTTAKQRTPNRADDQNGEWKTTEEPRVPQGLCWGRMWGCCRQQTLLPSQEGGRAAKPVPPGHWFQLLLRLPPERHVLTFASQHLPVGPADHGSLPFPNKPTLLETALSLLV